MANSKVIYGVLCLEMRCLSCLIGPICWYSSVDEPPKAPKDRGSSDGNQLVIYLYEIVGWKKRLSTAAITDETFRIFPSDSDVV